VIDPRFAAALDALKGQLSQMLAELRANQRLRMGLVLILAILAGYGLLNWRDALDQKEKSVDRLGQEIGRLRGLEGTGPIWRRRAERTAQARRRFEERLWPAPSLELAQASFQDWVASRLSRLGVLQPKLTLIDADSEQGVDAGEHKDARKDGEQAESGDGEAAKAKTAPPPQPIKLGVSFDYSVRQLEDFLAQVYLSGRNIRVDTLLASAPKRKVELVLTIWTVPGKERAPREVEIEAAPDAMAALMKGLPQ
jgi:hypothetical protein